MSINQPKQKNLSKPNSYKKYIGAQTEEEVARYLLDKKFSVISKNFLIKGGEIDIIARKGNMVAFIEVKFRKKAYQCTSELVNTAKQKKIIYAAKKYMSLQEEDLIYRFDVALVTQEEPRITYIENAFCGQSW